MIGMNKSAEKQSVHKKGIVLTKKDREILDFLKGIARRRLLQSWLFFFGWCVLVAALAAFVWNVTAIFVPVYRAELYGYLSVFAGFLVSFLVIMIRHGSIYDAARYADAAGLQERLVTSIEYQGNDEGVIGLLKEDTLEEIRHFDKKLRLPLLFPWKRYAASVLFFCMFLICSFVPSQAKKDAVAMHRLAVQAKEEKDKIEEAMELLDEASEDKSEEAEAARLTKLLKEARQELLEAGSEEEIERAAERLKSKLKQELAESDSNRLLNSVQPLVPDTDLAGMAGFNKKLAKLTENGGISSELAGELSGAAESLSAEQMEQLLGNLEQAMEDGELSSSEAAAALSDINNRDAQMAAATITASSVRNGSGDGSNGLNGSEGGNGNGSGSAGSPVPGNGSGNGSGAGWNTGSSEGMERTGEEGKGEAVYLTGKQQGDDDNLTGILDGEAKYTEKSSQKGNALSGSKVDLDTVIGRYSSAAYAKINSNKVPSARKDVVKEYFSGLGNAE